MLSNQWIGFYMITASVMKNLNELRSDLSQKMQEIVQKESNEAVKIIYLI